MLRSPSAIAFFVAFVTILALGIGRVWSLERNELDVVSDAIPTSGSPMIRLDERVLRTGETALFEVCGARGDLVAMANANVVAAVWRPSDSFLLVRQPIRLVDARGPRACVFVARGPVPAEGTYAFELAAERGVPRTTTLYAHVAVTQALGAVDLSLLVVLAFLVLSAVLVALAKVGRVSDATTQLPRHVPGSRAALALVVVVLGEIALTSWRASGATLGLVKGLLLAVVLLGACGVAAMRDGPSVLGVVRPRWGGAIAPLAGVLGLGLAAAWGAAKLVAMLPTSGEAPVETFVAWPSGALAFSVLALVVPGVEELFFRGFVFGAALPKAGPVGAAVVSALAFVAMHVPQAWGAWGGLVSIAILGTLLSVLRAASGSVLVTAGVHVLYNLVLVTMQRLGG